MLSKKTLMEVGLTDIDAGALAERNDQGDYIKEIANLCSKYTNLRKPKNKYEFSRLSGLEILI